MKRPLLISVLLLFNIACDQITKHLARINLLDSETNYLINNILSFKKVENAGAIMGIGSNLPDMIKAINFQILPLLFLLYLLKVLLTKPAISKKAVVGLCFALGGGIGNLIDRIIHGSVTDFIILNVGFFETGIFNLADVSIIIGVIILFIEILFNDNNNLYESFSWSKKSKTS